MIPIKIEATNPGSIGSYKNTPFQHPIPPREHTKPIKGSYKDWIESKLTESKHIFLEDMNLSVEELIHSIIAAISQNPKYSYIAYWIDNDVDDAITLESNNKELYNIINTKLLKDANDYIVRHEGVELNANELCKLWDNQLSALNTALKQQYSEVI